MLRKDEMSETIKFVDMLNPRLYANISLQRRPLSFFISLSVWLVSALPMTIAGKW